jgi:hypothetical protein
VFRVARQMIQLIATLVLLLRRWSRGRNRAPYLSAGCLVVLTGAVALIAICCLAALLFVALLFLKGAIP